MAQICPSWNCYSLAATFVSVGLGPVVRTRCVCILGLVVCGSLLFLVLLLMRESTPLLQAFVPCRTLTALNARFVVFYYFQLLHPGSPPYGPGVAKLAAPPVAAW